MVVVELIEIDKNEYLSYLNKLDTHKKSFIDSNQYSDKYYSLVQNITLKAFVGVRLDKNNMIHLNGLFSLYKGFGKILIEELTKELNSKYVKLNCTEDVLLSYYTNLGFKLNFSDLENKYQELSKQV